MQKYRSILRRRATFFLIDSLLIAISLTAWTAANKPVPTERTISYNSASDHILVQLAKLSEHDGDQMHPEPMWTLYGDGTLIFRADSDDTSWLAQLSPGEIQHILDVIINQHAFFDSTTHQYGGVTPERDDDGLLLIVDVHGQQKEVVLESEPTSQIASDLQTSHVFSIEQFLLDYHPLHTVPYASDPASEGDSDDGK